MYIYIYIHIYIYVYIKSRDSSVKHDKPENDRPESVACKGATRSFPPRLAPRGGSRVEDRPSAPKAL